MDIEGVGLTRDDTLIAIDTCGVALGLDSASKIYVFDTSIVGASFSTTSAGLLGGRFRLCWYAGVVPFGVQDSAGELSSLVKWDMWVGGIQMAGNGLPLLTLPLAQTCVGQIDPPPSPGQCESRPIFGLVLVDQCRVTLCLLPLQTTQQTRSSAPFVQPLGLDWRQRSADPT